LNFGLIRM